MLIPLRAGRRQEMAAISGAHALFTNIVLAWNTYRRDSVVAKLNRDGVGIEEDWLAGRAFALAADRTQAMKVLLSFD
ncbi:hypothetical protein [Aquabacterium sp.]|uniref:hypothetical protein n=1 Tax=Aquabacterium sp. TaxID=1872578 RepID=UPI0039C8860D